ncbi:uncharacterized protein G2W53_014849 [Senna tora]|uniref:Uncharacterized protein n=1 Tax=Senna tora TaxID=362788 RepID=A0A835C725_9FABA|nr:uncharacterized protein G2W53_014849 [Senna tora]
MHQISRRRRLVAADLAGENSEVLRESEGEEASAAAEEEVFRLEQILSEKTQKCFGRVKEKKPPPPRKRKCLVWRDIELKQFAVAVRTQSHNPPFGLTVAVRRSPFAVVLPSSLLEEKIVSLGQNVFRCGGFGEKKGA